MVHVGTISAAGMDALASDLAAARFVACAQLSDTDLQVKTTSAGKAAVQTKLAALDGASVDWEPIAGNQHYLEWVTKETLSATNHAKDTA